MSNAFQVESGQLRGAAALVEGCCRQIESGRKADAAAGVSSGMAGFAVVGACESARAASGTAFAGVARSWLAWSEAAAAGASSYEMADLGSSAVLRAAASGLVV